MQKPFLSSNEKDLTPLVSYLVDFSIKNSIIIHQLSKNSIYYSLIKSLYEWSFYLPQGQNQKSFETILPASLSELLTFLFFSFNFLDPKQNYKDSINFIISSPDCILYPVFEGKDEEIIISFFKQLNFKSIFSFLSDKNFLNILSSFQDPFKTIYESFFVKYNKNLQKKTGAYYSPDEGISFIVKSIEQLLLTNELIKHDDKSSFVFMDPSCGTGSFLVETYKMMNKFYNKEHFTTNKKEIIGFDINIVSYLLTLQNLKLVSKNTNKMSINELFINVLYINPLLNINDSNTLKNIPKLMTKFIADLKQYRSPENTFQIIFGNPPYSAVSNNSNEWINNLLKGIDINTNKITYNYFEVDGKSINEKKSGWLLDDYSKFIRLGHFLIDQSHGGILSFISNNSFLSNPSFRGMRCQLLKSFDELYILDLHGNKLVDTPPNDIVDENIFNIIQGNCIFIFIKHQFRVQSEQKVSYFEIWGSKKEKLKFLQNNTYNSVPWTTLTPQKPFYAFLPENEQLRKHYTSFWSIKDIFKESGTGLITSKDSLAIQFTKKDLIKVLKDFSSLDPETARKKYSLGPDTENWRVISAQKDILTHGISENRISTIVYRPFDIRFTYFTGKANGFHGRPKAISNSLFKKQNLAIISARTNKTRNNDHFFVGATLIEAKCAESSTQSYIFPLRAYYDGSEENNFNPLFIKAIENNFHITFSENDEQTPIITSSKIFSYIYAIFFSPSYRTIFKPFFMYDFPRIPLVKDFDTFEIISNLGAELISIHTMQKTEINDCTLQHHFTLNGAITKVSYKDSKLFINKADYFYPIQKSVFRFTVGNYKILKKWLISRKNLTFTNELLLEFTQIVCAIKKTLEIVKKIEVEFSPFVNQETVHKN